MSESNQQSSPFMHLDEFIKFADEMNPDVGPMFGRDASRLAHEYRSLIEQLEAAQEALNLACDVAIWLSGLPCLRESEAWHTWEGQMRPQLFKALDARISNPALSPSNEDVRETELERIDREERETSHIRHGYEAPESA